jgi:glutathione synthase/RimK-type ligase-like ATP-grasp enzyme
MTGRVAILAPDPASEDAAGRWHNVFEKQAAPLRRARLTVEACPWTDDDAIGTFDLVLPLLAWGYHKAGPRWAEATLSWEARSLPVHNPPSVLRWNADKLYLSRLAAAGLPVAPVRFVDRVTEAVLNEAAEAFGAAELIAKPQVSASAYRTIRWTPGTPLDGAPEGAAILQPFLPAILDEGEISLIYFEGRFCHAIRKRPQPGDFRVQPEYRGDITAHTPAPDERAAADAILAALDERDLLYARVDLVRGADGAPLLMELELVEPELYLEHDPGGGAAFVAAVKRAAA